MSLPLIAWPDAERVDRHRLTAGALYYCPVCRRPASTELLGPVAGMRRLARHLTEAHDPTFAALLRSELGRPAPQPATEVPDPSFPGSDPW